MSDPSLAQCIARIEARAASHEFMGLRSMAREARGCAQALRGLTSDYEPPTAEVMKDAIRKLGMNLSSESPNSPTGGG